MAYTINANAKNVWIRDNDDTMDLSPLTDASSVYLDNGRTLEQELGEGSMVSNVTTVDGAMSKVIDGTLDGVYESGVMYGRSLVNLVDGHSSLTDDTNVYTMFSNGIYTYSAKEGYDGNIAPAYILTLNMIQRLTAGKTYTVLLTQLDSNDCRFAIATRREDWSGVVAYYEPNSSIDRVRKFKFTLSSEDYTHVQLRLISCADSVKSIRFKDIMIIEGDYTDKDIPFFTGLCDAKMPILRNVGKNLFNPDTFIPFDKGEEYVRYEDGYVVANFKNANTHFFYEVDLSKMSKGMYSIIDRHDGETSYLGIEYTFKDGTKTWGGKQFNNDGSYAKLGLYMQSTPSDPSLKVKAKIMLVAGGDSTALHEDHKTNILHTPETVTLRSLPNGVRDELNLKTGEYAKRIGEVTFDGSETIELWWKKTNNLYFGFRNISNVYKPRYNRVYMNCDKLPVATVSPNVFSNGDYEGVCVWDDNYPIVIGINKTKLSEETLAAFKTYLATNPITVQYELAEPIIAKVALTQSEPIVKIGTELPNGVCDTYNLLTGEHIQRVGKVVLDGSEVWKNTSLTSNDGQYYISYCPLSSMKKYMIASEVISLTSDKFVSEPPVGDDEAKRRNREFIASYGSNATVVDGESNWIYLSVEKRKIADSRRTSFSNYLKSNPITVWYELKSPIITKKNGLPNTYEVVLPNGVRDRYVESTNKYIKNIGRITFDGSEDWIQNQGGSYGFYYYHNESKTSSSFNCRELNTISGWNDYTEKGIFKGSVAWGIVVEPTDLTSCTKEAFKEWLKQNPATVEYELATSKTIDIPIINVGQVLPNGICDTYNPITKEYVRRVGFTVLDGSEDWIKHSGNSSQYTYKTVDKLSGYGVTYSYCDTMKTEAINGGISNTYGYSFVRVGENDAVDNGDFGVFIHLEGEDIVTDVSSLKKKLSLNPLNLWYELQTPETSTVDLDLTTLYSSNPFAYENGHVILESGYDGQTLLPTLEYSTVTSRVKQIESIGEQVLRQEKQLTMLEQMLIQNIIGLDYNNVLLALNLEIDEVM